MDREKIMDDLEDLQHKTDAMGFVGSNEHDLWLREAIADYVIKLFAIPVVSKQSELFISFARFVENYGDKRYEASYENMLEQWKKQKNI